MFTSIFELLTLSANERTARSIVRNYAKQLDPAAVVRFKKESNGTVRFDTGLLGEQGFYRVRTSNNVNACRGLSSGNLKGTKDSFDQVHIGRITVAFNNLTGRDVWNFSVAAESESN